MYEYLNLTTDLVAERFIYITPFLHMQHRCHMHAISLVHLSESSSCSLLMIQKGSILTNRIFIITGILRPQTSGWYQTVNFIPRSDRSSHSHTVYGTWYLNKVYGMRFEVQSRSLHYFLLTHHKFDLEPSIFLIYHSPSLIALCCSSSLLQNQVVFIIQSAFFCEIDSLIRLVF